MSFWSACIQNDHFLENDDIDLSEFLRNSFIFYIEQSQTLSTEISIG